jgi:hypothetical protein
MMEGSGSEPPRICLRMAKKLMDPTDPEHCQKLNRKKCKRQALYANPYSTNIAHYLIIFSLISNGIGSTFNI